jgi:hypothetical protein
MNDEFLDHGHLPGVIDHGHFQVAATYVETHRPFLTAEAEQTHAHADH